MTPPPAREMRRRTRLPLFFLVGLILAQLVNPDRAIMMMLVGLLAAWGMAWVWARQLRDHVNARRMSRVNWVVVGDPIIEDFEVTHTSLLPLLWAEVLDFSDLPGYAIQRVVAVGGHGAFAWHTEGLCQQRGVFSLGPWALRMRDPLGLYEVTLHFPQSRSLLVYPRVMQLPEFPLPQGRTSGHEAPVRPVPFQGDQVGTVRPWQPGDSLHLIHWKQTAHTGQLMVKQLDQEPAGDVWIMLDLDAQGHVGEGQESTLEYGVTLAASLAAKYLAEHRAVGFIALEREPIIMPPQRGRDHLWHILHALAHVSASSPWPLDQALREMRIHLGRHKTLLLITPVGPQRQPDWLPMILALRRQDVAPAVILLDAASFLGQANPVLPVTETLLADLDVPTTVVAQGYPFQPLGLIHRRRKVLKTLPGFGRVVEVEVEEWV